MPNGTCHGCAQGIHEFISVEGQKRMEQCVKDMAPWPIGKGKTGPIRHRHIEPDAPCNGVIWFYNEDPTPPGGEAYMSWFSNPIVNKTIQTIGGAPPPKPRPVQQALYHGLDSHGVIIESWDVTESVHQLIKANGCHSLTAGRPLQDVLYEHGALAEPVCQAEPEREPMSQTEPESEPEEAAAGAGAEEGVPPTYVDTDPEPAAAESLAAAAEPDNPGEPGPERKIREVELHRLSITVDGSSHDIDLIGDMGTTVSLRTAMKC